MLQVVLKDPKLFVLILHVFLLLSNIEIHENPITFSNIAILTLSSISLCTHIVTRAFIKFYNSVQGNTATD